jgi:N-hydroxyarylamine O-acetyltransferase
MSETDLDIAAYLARLDYFGSRTPDVQTLRALHRAHLYAVPFENLDIPLGRPISLDPDALFDKIVTQHRGGFCYELNGLFARLLWALGFRVTLLAARDSREDGSLGPEFDHLTLRVTCPADDDRIPWLADVGWGDTFRDPLRLDTDELQPQDARAYRIETGGLRRYLWQREANGSWERQYAFTLQPRRFSEFAGTCLYHQTSPESSFTRHVIVTRAMPDGRVTLSGLRLITTRDGAREEREVAPPAYLDRLREYFGITLDRSPFER